MAKRKIEDIGGLLDQRTDWGLTMSEATTRRTAKGRIFLLLSYGFLGVAALLLLPVIAGFLFFPNYNDILHEFAIMAFCICAGLAFKVNSGRPPRNAVQIDYRAAQLRLGYQKKDNTFIRERVITFRDIDAVYVDHGANGEPHLTVMLTRNEVLTLPFNKASVRDLENLAAKIASARESIKRAPIRSRVQSAVHGFGASVREARTRVKSRVAHG